jgi:phosphoenolpyruvate carboxylase
VGDYSSWSEDERIAWLVQELESKRPLIPPSMPMTGEVKEVRVAPPAVSDELGAIQLS